MIAGAGAAEATIALLTIKNQSIPPTANLGRIGDEIGLDIVHGEPRPFTPAPVLSNSFGFGGHNATLIVAPVGSAGA
jgi:3-oxoacyl-[acyl-carrier-protein] synthase II